MKTKGRKKRLRNILTIISESYSQMHGRKIIVLPFGNTAAIASSKRRWEVDIARNGSALGAQCLCYPLHCDSRQGFKV